MQEREKVKKVSILNARQFLKPSPLPRELPELPQGIRTASTEHRAPRGSSQLQLGGRMLNRRVMQRKGLTGTLGGSKRFCLGRIFSSTEPADAHWPATCWVPSRGPRETHVPHSFSEAPKEVRNAAQILKLQVHNLQNGARSLHGERRG